MSFILDALRKSDTRRQQSGAPGLNSPEPPRSPRRPRRRLLPWLAVGLALFAVAAAALYIVRPDWLPPRVAGTGQAELSGDGAARERLDAAPSEIQSASGAADEATGEQLAQEDASSGPAAQPEAPPKPVAEEDEAVGEKNVTRQDGDPREEPREAPRDRRQPIRASPERTVRRETPPRESRPMPADEATKELERRLAAEALRRRESPAEPSQSKERSRPADSTREESRPEPEAATTPAQPKPLNEGVAEYVRAWELPLSVRRSLPEMNLSIHVFSPNEAERFVLINGERYVPGDAIGDARIVDISRDGAIVDFRSHRFLLEPR